MEFLRRLAASREPDPSRAMAVLPSRYATEVTVRSDMADLRHGHEGEEHGSSFALATPPAPPASFAVPSPSAAAAPPDTTRDGMRFDAVAAAMSTRPTTAGNDDGHVPADRGSPNDTAPAGTRWPRVAAALPADHGTEESATMQAQPRRAFPLTDAALAQRAPQPRDDGQVVHVTIGRIDVVANAAAAPPARRSAKREGAVTLSEYLRRGSGSRR